MEIRDRLTAKAQDQINRLVWETPQYLLESGWVGPSEEPNRPDFAVQAALKDAGLIGIYPYSREARRLAASYMGRALPHNEGCTYENVPPLGVISMEGVLVCSIPVWEMMAVEIAERGMSVLINPETPKTDEGTKSEHGEGVIGPQQGGEGIGPSHVMGFRFRLNEAGELEVQQLGEDGEPVAPSPETPQIKAAEDRLMARARRVSSIAQIRHIVAIMLQEDLSDGWYGAERPEAPEGQEAPISDVQVMMNGASGMLMLRPHTDKGRAFVTALADGTYGDVSYAYRTNWTQRGFDPDDPCPEHIAAITSWPVIVTLADTVAEVTLHFSPEEEGDVPCGEPYDEDDEEE